MSETKKRYRLTIPDKAVLSFLAGYDAWIDVPDEWQVKDGETFDWVYGENSGTGTVMYVTYAGDDQCVARIKKVT